METPDEGRKGCRGTRVLTDPVRYWRTLAARTGRASKTGKVFETKTGKAEATLLLAATRGLLLDLCATGDRRRVTEALNLLPRLLASDSKKTSALFLAPRYTASSIKEPSRNRA